MKTLIALAGPAGAGKSTAAEILAREHGFHRERFAAPLKAMFRSLLWCANLGQEEIDRMTEGDLKQTPHPALMGRTPRHAMQTLGTEWARDTISPDLWVGLARRRIEPMRRRGKAIAFEDCRFENEAQLVRALGGVVIRLEGRGGIPGDHASERPLPADIVIDNSGGIAALADALERAVFR